MSETRTYSVFVNPSDPEDMIFVPVEYVRERIVDLELSTNGNFRASALHTRNDPLRLIRESCRYSIKDYCEDWYGNYHSCSGCKYSWSAFSDCIFTDCPDSWDVYED